jgi:Flp pilus assembly CpaE family ATPase
LKPGVRQASAQDAWRREAQVVNQRAGEPLRLLLVARHVRVRDALAEALKAARPSIGEVRLHWVAAPELAAAPARDLEPHAIFLAVGKAEGPGGQETDVTILQLRDAAPDTAVVALVAEKDFTGASEAVLAGARAFLMLPLTAAQLATTLDQVVQREGAEALAPMPEGPEGKVIVFCSPKGGTGRTTLAINMSVSIRHQTGQPIVVMDCDYAAPAIDVVLNFRNQPTVLDLLPRLGDLDVDTLLKILATHKNGLRALLAPSPELMEEPLTFAQVQAVIGWLRRLFPWVIVDMGLPIDDMAMAFLDLADVAVVSVLPEAVCLRNGGVLMRQFDQRGYPPGKVWPLLNRDGLPGGLPEDEVAKRLGRPLRATVPNDQDLATETINRGVPVVIGYKHTRLARAYRKLTAELVAELAPGGVQGGGWEPLHETPVVPYDLLSPPVVEEKPGGLAAVVASLGLGKLGRKAAPRAGAPPDDRPAPPPTEPATIESQPAPVAPATPAPREPRPAPAVDKAAWMAGAVAVAAMAEKSHRERNEPPAAVQPEPPPPAAKPEPVAAVPADAEPPAAKPAPAKPIRQVRRRSYRASAAGPAAPAEAGETGAQSTADEPGSEFLVEEYPGDDLAWEPPAEVPAHWGLAGAELLVAGYAAGDMPWDAPADAPDDRSQAAGADAAGAPPEEAPGGGPQKEPPIAAAPPPAPSPVKQPRAAPAKQAKSKAVAPSPGTQPTPAPTAGGAPPAAAAARAAVASPVAAASPGAAASPVAAASPPPAKQPSLAPTPAPPPAKQPSLPPSGEGAPAAAGAPVAAVPIAEWYAEAPGDDSSGVAQPPLNWRARRRMRRLAAAAGLAAEGMTASREGAPSAGVPPAGPDAPGAQGTATAAAVAPGAPKDPGVRPAAEAVKPAAAPPAQAPMSRPASPPGSGPSAETAAFPPPPAPSASAPAGAPERATAYAAIPPGYAVVPPGYVLVLAETLGAAATPSTAAAVAPTPARPPVAAPARAPAEPDDAQKSVPFWRRQRRKEGDRAAGTQRAPEAGALLAEAAGQAEIALRAATEAMEAASAAAAAVAEAQAALAALEAARQSLEVRLAELQAELAAAAAASMPAGGAPGAHTERPGTAYDVIQPRRPSSGLKLPRR